MRPSLTDLPSWRTVRYESDARFIDAARIMNDNDTAAVPVLDENGQPCGVVSAMSLAGVAELD